MDNLAANMDKIALGGVAVLFFLAWFVIDLIAHYSDEHKKGG